MKRVFLIIIIAFTYLGLSAQDYYTDPRDGNTYRTITFNGITWMAENMKYIFPGTTKNYFDNDPNNASGYGVLYDWETAMKVCPDGWHLPTGQEFRALTNHLEEDEMWERSGSGPVSFDIQLGGMRNYEGTFTEMDESAYFWTSTEYSDNEAEYFSYLVLNDHPVVDVSREADAQDIHGSEKINKYSVRCIKD